MTREARCAYCGAQEYDDKDVARRGRARKFCRDARRQATFRKRR